jgi:light-regulated signal transduction histidine kinase (bacteriophytochrome)
MHPEQAVESRGKLDDVIQNPGVIYQRINRFKCKDGSFIWCEGTVINLLYDENVKAIVSNYRNITDKKLAEEKLKELNDELEGKVEQRTQELAQTIKELEMFTYTVSHDLRTPLNAIYGFANLLSEFHKNDLNEEGKEYVWHIVAAAKRMTDLIGDLLHLSKLGKMQIEKSKVDMNALVRKVKYDFEKANQHQAQISIKALPNVDGDASLLEQVWMNLISNAVKYSAKKDCSVVQIGVEYENENTIFYVKDNGAGFDMNQASKLFGVFQRMHTSSEFEGTGVGLAIVKLIIEKHEGKIWAESKINEGTTFYFSLEDGNGAKNSW